MPMTGGPLTSTAMFLDILVTRLRKLLTRQQYVPQVMVTAKLASYGVAYPTPRAQRRAPPAR
jgi:hypothetical protein